MANNILFPPIVDTYQPIFIQGEDCKIYFAFSQFNSKDDVKDQALVSIVNPNTNKSILYVSSDEEVGKESYIYGMGLFEIDKNNNFITIPNSALQDGLLPLNQYFKVQIRFIKASVTATGDDLYKLNAEQMSEWSAATLIRNISQPTLNILNFTSDEDTVLLEKVGQIDGKLTFDDVDEKDKLNSYRVKLFDENNILIDDSGTLYNNALNNSFSYLIKVNLNSGKAYRIEIIYTTDSGYSDTYIKNFTTAQGIQTALGLIKATTDNDNGIVHLAITLIRNSASTYLTGTLNVRRFSYKDNFTKAEILWSNQVSFLSSYVFKLDDVTVENGTCYRYDCQLIAENGAYYTYPTNNIIINFDDIFLTDSTAQLRIKFNPSVNSMKYVVVESVTNTLGGKYPIVRRNGNTNYRQFTIGGLISFRGDPDEEIFNPDSYEDSLVRAVRNIEYKDSLLLTQKDAFKNALNDYKNLSNDDYDFILERLYREKAEEFLNNNSVKLFRSTAEGNILVTLTNISFTPNAQLSNRVYSFSATATEIDEATLDNYYKYGILKEGAEEYTSLYVLRIGENEPDFSTGTVYIGEDKIVVAYATVDELGALKLEERVFPK